jgi:hypothetical protein
MAKCNFSIAFDGDASQLVEKARKEILQAGGTFNGNETAGVFSLGTPLGTVKGNYTIREQIFMIDILEKPMLVGCSRIESELRRYMETTTLEKGTSDTGL